MVGWHWKKIGPSRGPSGSTAARNSAMRSPVFFSRRKWVMPWLALRVKTKSSGVAFDQLSIIAAVGRRRKV